MGSKTGCPFCKRKQRCPHDNLLVNYPEIAAEWDHERNKKSPDCYLAGSNDMVWWKCKEENCDCHIYQARINSRTSEQNGCPFCLNRQLCPHNNLLARYPNIGKEWCHKKNIKGPECYPPGSGDMVWWECPINPCGCHIYQSTINNRTSNGNNCPYCTNRSICPHNNLSVLYPSIANEWDFEINQKLPSDYVPGSNDVVNWICPINPLHKYRSSIATRTNGSRCLICNESNGEALVRSILVKYNILFEKEWRITEFLPTKRYDFYFQHQGVKWIIEYDGPQHFHEVPFFHRKDGDFEHEQETDKIKTYIACNTGYKLIRIDYTNCTESTVEAHILKAFQHQYPVYYSNDEMYKWLSSGKINKDTFIKEVPKYII